MNKDLKNCTLDELVEIVKQAGQKKYLAKYIFTFIHKENVVDISQITTLSKAFRQNLIDKGYYISSLSVSDALTDPDGTIKYAFELPGGERIESVLLFDEQRKTLCVSTQTGCQMNCVFCATAKVKYRGNLSAAQIVDQVNVIEKEKGRIGNVVFMGMGEPFENYDNVIKAVRILNHSAGKNIGIRHLTISTCGIVPAIRKFIDEDIQPRLAISLNAANDKLRTKIMPINKKYSIKELMDAVNDYNHRTKQRVTFEYILIKGLNDSIQCAGELARLVKPIKCNINLIEYNEHQRCKFQASSRASIKQFKAVLEEAGLETTIRFKMGRKIKAACGQLGAKYSDFTIQEP